MTAQQKQDLGVLIKYGGIIVAGALAFAAVRSTTMANAERIDDHEVRIRTFEKMAYQQHADILIIKAAVTKP